MAESPLLSIYTGRAGGIEGLNGGFRARLEAMYSAMPANIRGGFKIGSAFRSVDHQAELYQAAIKKYGSEAAARKWVAPPGKSNHGRGGAVDLSFGSDAVRQWVHANAARFGMRFPMAHEPWHIEPIGGVEGADQDAYTIPPDGTTPAMPTVDTSLEGQLLTMVDFIRGDAWEHYSAPVSAAAAAQQDMARRRLQDLPQEQLDG